MGLYKKSNIFYTNEIAELQGQIEGNKRQIVKLSEELAEYKRYLTINPKTGLPNHKIFVKDLEKLIIVRNKNGKSPFALIFIDLYKSMTKIEYSLDSCLSDAIIAKACMEVKEVLEDMHNQPMKPFERLTMISRAPLEGIEYNIYHSERNEEVMIIIRNIDDRKKCVHIARTIYNKITEPKQLEFNNDIIRLVCHMAAAFYPEDGTIKEELLSNTDIALRFGIEQNKKLLLYSKHLGEKVREKKILETDLRNIFHKKNNASAQKCFELYFQPIIDSNYKIIGAESLIRWNHPEKGLIMPGFFIDLAEETGLIVPLGYYVLKKACQYIRSWQDRSLLHKDFFLSINFSPKQFKQQNLSKKINAALSRYKVESRYLKIEITESAYFDNSTNTVRTIEELSDMGIRLMIDDCGAPGNAIYNLRTLPEELIKKGVITTLKLDKSLIDTIEHFKDRLFFKHNLEMAWRLNFNVVVEGIETTNQERILKDIEEELIRDQIKINISRQGYLFSRPVPEAEFIDLLQKKDLNPNKINL